MSKQNPRVALTVPKDLNDTLQRLSELQGVPKTKLIIDMLQEYKPVLDKVVDALERIEADKMNGVAIAKDFGSNLLLDAHEQLGQIASEVKKL
jgi:hypothetical protein